MKQPFPVIQNGKPNQLSLIKVEQRTRRPRPKPEPDPQQPNMGGYLLIFLLLLGIALLAVAAFN